MPVSCVRRSASVPWRYDELPTSTSSLTSPKKSLGTAACAGAAPMSSAVAASQVMSLGKVTPRGGV